jgi:hypothetical protein
MSAFDGTNGPTLKVQFLKSGTWTNTVTTDLREINIKRGRSRADQKMDAGTATITLDNRSGWYDPDYLGTDSPWVVSGASLLRDGLKGRVVATWDSVSYVIFTGYLETTGLNAGFDAVATMTFVDGIALIAKGNAPTLKNKAYANETTATRVGRMLTLAQWGSGSRSLDGAMKMQATEQGADCMTLIEQCVAAEAGAFYISGSGVATLITLADKFARPTQLLFNDQRVANTVEYSDIVTTPGTRQVVNQCILTRGKLKQVVANYKPSQNSYGIKSVEVECLNSDQTKAQRLALYYSRKDANPKTTVESITFMALALDVLYPDFLTTELLDQVTVKRRTVDGRSLTINLVIEGIEHKISPNNWETTYSTSPLNPYRIKL